MKQKLLLTAFIASGCLAVNAQKSSVYAITGTQAGSNNWTEVRLVDVASGQELKTVYKSSEQTPILNARTGKPVVKKDPAPMDNLQMARLATGTIREQLPEGVRVYTIRRDGTAPVVITTDVPPTPAVAARVKEVRDGNIQKVKDGDIQKIIVEQGGQVIRIQRDGVTQNLKELIAVKEAQAKVCTTTRTEVLVRMSPSLDKPFSTYSAACAYDKKHERLYYTPMGIAQLRYIDLKANTVNYFEDEQFGALRNRGDISNQITRMVMGADGNGYALTNNADHLIQFTTSKKAVITDLGGLTDDPANGKFSVHNSGGYGGDIIASKNGDLYLITANHNIFQISIKNLTATYRGTIQGLPRGYSTNGAAVEEGTMVLVNSSNSTEGYYHFDINKLQAEKLENSGQVYNASDLANANLLNDKKQKEEKPEEVVQQQQVVQQPTVDIAPVKNKPVEEIAETRLSVYPNPVTNGVVNLVLENYTLGKYQAKLIDVTGKQLSAKTFNINSKAHTEPFNLAPSIAKGNYLIQLYDQSARSAGIVKLVVQ